MEQHNMATKDVLRRARFALGISQTELAEKIGVHKSVISMYEKGKRKPSFPTINKIVKIMKEKGIELRYEDFMDDEN